MNEPMLDAIRDLIQEDVGGRGLRTDPQANLISACADDFAAACYRLAQSPGARLAVVTGFFIPHGEPPGGETDGPLGALFLARALAPLGMEVVLATDDFCAAALHEGLKACDLEGEVPLVTLPPAATLPSGANSNEPAAQARAQASYREEFARRAGQVTHLIALERAGPSHTPESVRRHPGATAEDVECFLGEVPAPSHGRCHTMGGRDITPRLSPAHLLFEAAPGRAPVTTIGIGDGGNEIGMGKIPWEVIRRNIPKGGQVACRVATNHLIVCGVSNWGAYGLAAGVRLLIGSPPDAELFDVGRERDLLRVMVERGPLVDGVSGKPAVTVDGLEFERYAEPLRRLGQMEGSE
jgi:hypothetical protein